jgi:hypothetical protein
MEDMDVCYRYQDSFVFPGLLPVLRPAEVARQVWTTPSADRSVFGRRFAVADGSSLPPTLPLLMHRQLLAIAETVDLVRRDHFFFNLRGCNVMVRFNTAAVAIRSSSGHSACSLDIAVSTSRVNHREGAHVLDRVVLALCELLTDDRGPCCKGSVVLCRSTR